MPLLFGAARTHLTDRMPKRPVVRSRDATDLRRTHNRPPPPSHTHTPHARTHARTHACRHPRTQPGMGWLHKPAEDGSAPLHARTRGARLREARGAAVARDAMQCLVPPLVGWPPYPADAARLIRKQDLRWESTARLPRRRELQHVARRRNALRPALQRVVLCVATCHSAQRSVTRAQLPGGGCTW